MMSVSVEFWNASITSLQVKVNDEYNVVSYQKAEELLRTKDISEESPIRLAW